MSHRNFVDNAGRRWDAWTVTPEKVERRISKPNATLPFEDRRMKSEFRVKIGKDMVNGWLCFETEGEKRRLSPIPDDWESLSDHDLSALCARAAVARPHRPRRSS